MTPWMLPRWAVYALTALAMALVLAGLSIPWWGPA